MAISINWATLVISVPQADLTLVSGTLYELDVDVFRLALKDLEDSEEGMPFPATHNHATEVTLSGVTYARTFEIINGYTVTFEDTGSPYTVRMVGANHNIADVTNYISEVSLIVGNSAGLIVTTGGGGGGSASWTDVMENGLTYGEVMRLMAAVLLGKTTIAAGPLVTFKGVDETTDRVVASMTGSERTTVTLDPT